MKLNRDALSVYTRSIHAYGLWNCRHELGLPTEAFSVASFSVPQEKKRGWVLRGSPLSASASIKTRKMGQAIITEFAGHKASPGPSSSTPLL